MKVPEEQSFLDKLSGNIDESVDMNIGGQAVIEGVMMRSPQAIATAVRMPDGTIEMKKREYISFVKRHKLFDIPVVRGAVSFFEMIFIGFDTLNWSADIQMKYENMKNQKKTTEKNTLSNTLILGVTIVFAIIAALGIFFALPIYMATMFGLSKGAFLFNLVAGIIRLVLFFLYIALISLIPDMKRIFRYHGAEHMSIFTLEASAPLDVTSAKNKSRFHPRCGTSFIIIVALFSMILFGIADSLFPLIFKHMQSFPERLATHLCLLPLVAGTSFELLKLSGKFRSKRLIKILTAPGLWLQKMTTAEPDDDMLEVALCALKAVQNMEKTQT